MDRTGLINVTSVSVKLVLGYMELLTAAGLHGTDGGVIWN